MASLLSQQQEAVLRLAQVPGLGVASAQQIIAEVGAKAASFPSEKHLSSWVGACPGDEGLKAPAFRAQEKWLLGFLSST
jgi:transposase